MNFPGTIYKRTPYFPYFLFLFLGVNGQGPQVPPLKSCSSISWTDRNCFLGPVSINSDIAPKVFHQLCPNARGKNEAPTSCDLYITCHDDSLTVNRCPAESHFHPIDKLCVDAHLFECSYPAVKDPSILLKGEEPSAKDQTKREASLHWAYGNSDTFTFRKNWKDDYCQDGEEGIFAHPESCEYFIQCGSARLFEQKCPTGTTFNPRLSICDRNRDENCRSRNKRSLISNLDTILSSTDIKASETHQVQKRSVPCPKDYVVPHPQFCNNFEICSNGRFLTQSCGKGTLFDPLKKICSDPKNVDCGARIRDFDTYDCQPGFKYSTLHPDDCHKFIECENEKIYIKSCPGKTIFNAEKGRCDYSHKTVCKSVISLEHDIDINFRKATNTRWVRDLSKYECEFNYIAPLDGSCNRFIECENKGLYAKNCGPGTAYNPLLGQCDWPYNVRSPDTQFCQKYLQCDGRKFVSKECPRDQYYNAGTGKCDSIDKVNCSGKVDDPRRRGEYLQSK